MNVSHSKIKTWRRCHKQYDYKYNQKLRRRVKNKNLFVGIMVHEILEAHFRGKKTQPIIKEFQKQYDKLFDEEKVELEGAVELAKAMSLNYIKTYEDEKLTVVDVEKQILVHLVDDIFLEGKIDLIVEDLRQRRMIGEHKTCKSIPDEQDRMADIQTVIYWWAEAQNGFKCSGVIWDYLRKKLPVVPELLKKGGLSKNKSIDTTHEIYLKAIHDNDLDEEEYEEILEMLKNKQDTFFRRITLPFNQALVDNVLDDTISAAKQIKMLGKVVKDRNLTRDCSWCDYNNLCQTELRGLDSEFMRKKEFTISSRPKGKKTNGKSKK